MVVAVKTYKRKRTGVLAEKIGMTFLYDKEGKRQPTTVLKMHDTVVVGVKTPAKEGYSAVVLATGAVKPKHLAKPQAGHFAKAGVDPKRMLKEFRVSEDALLTTGDQLSVSHFAVGQFVDVASESIGKGFAGVMKRHNFRGLEASHGVSITHRSHGSTGQRQDPGRVFKNKKMAGHLGAERVTLQNLQILQVDEARQLIFIKGGVAGAKGAFVEIRDAVKRAIFPTAPYPAALAKKTPETTVQQDEVVTTEQSSGE